MSGVIAPLWLAQMAATVDEVSNGRLIINIITGSDTAPALGIFQEQAAREANDHNHHGDFDGNGDGRNQCAKRPVQHVLEDHVADHGFCGSLASSSGWTNLVPGGCFNTKRSAAMGSLIVSFLISSWS